MRTTDEAIENNEVLTADFSSYSFNHKQATMLANALRKNKNITKLDFSYCYLKDDEFIIIATGLLKRNDIDINTPPPPIELILEGNRLTAKSIDVLSKLITQKKVKTSMLWYNKALEDDDKIKSDLNKLAKKHDVTISFVNPLERDDPLYFVRLELNTKSLIKKLAAYNITTAPFATLFSDVVRRGYYQGLLEEKEQAEENAQESNSVTIKPKT